jgi:hypothetical protein
MRSIKKFLLAIAAAGAASTAAAFADDERIRIESDDDDEVRYEIDEDDDDVDVRAKIDLDDDDVRVVREYYVERDCPEGLVRTDAGCLPPTGVVEKRYVIGQPLPQEVVAVDLPSDLVVQLPRLPEGHVYRIVDGDLVVVRESTLVVLDADDLY